MIEDYESINEMTDAQAAEVLENMRIRIDGGRGNGKTKLFYSYNVAMQKAIQKLKAGWIPIKTRPFTEEEKQNAIEKHDIYPDDLEYPFAWHFDCELPKLKEGEQSVDVLVTTHLGFAKVTNFFVDYLGCPCFEDMDEAGEFIAWMPLPEPYKKEGEEE